MSILTVAIADLKAHVDNYIAAKGMEVDGIVHKELAKFAAFVEGKQAVADAISLLKANGYEVIASTAPTSVQE